LPERTKGVKEMKSETWEHNFEKMTTMYEDTQCHRCGAPPGYFCRDGCEDIDIETILSPEQIEYLQAHQDMTSKEIAETINEWRNKALLNVQSQKYNPECDECGCYLKYTQSKPYCPRGCELNE